MTTFFDLCLIDILNLNYRAINILDLILLRILNTDQDNASNHILF